MSDEAEQKPEEEVAVAEEPAEDAAPVAVKPRRKHRKTQNPPMTFEEAKSKVIGWGERAAAGVVGWLATMAGENIQRVENVGERIADAFNDDEEEEGEEKAQ